MQCCLSVNRHILHEPLLLECGCNACKKCIDALIGSQAKCLNCNRSINQEKNLFNTHIDELIKTVYLKDLIAALEKEMSKKVEELEG